jgi:hypothetical protein
MAFQLRWGNHMPSDSLPLRPSVAFSFRAARRRMPSRKAPWHVAWLRRLVRATLRLVSAIKRSVPGRVRSA